MSVIRNVLPTLHTYKTVAFTELKFMSFKGLAPERPLSVKTFQCIKGRNESGTDAPNG